MSDLLLPTNFTAIDWVIVIAYPMISLGIGLSYRVSINRAQYQQASSEWDKRIASKRTRQRTSNV